MSSTVMMPAPGAAPDAEWLMLLAACSHFPRHQKLDTLTSLLQKPVQWGSLLARAEHHGVAPLLYRALSETGDETPPAELRRLKQFYQINLHKSLFLTRELIRILDCLDRLAIEVVPYKGVVLAEAVYGDIGLRQAGDIDLLIHARDLPRIKEAVRELGYTPHLPLSEAEERAYVISGYEHTFDSPAGRNVLELQWALQPRFYAVDLDVDSLFQQAVTVAVAGRNVKTPSMEHLLLVLSMHAAKHMWGRLIWLCDLGHIVNLPKLNWDWIADQAVALGMVRILRVTFLLLSQMLGTGPPDSVDSRLPADPEAWTLANSLYSQILGGPSYNVESLAYFRLMMRLRERRSDRMRFLGRLIFTSGPGEWKLVRLPAPLFPFYRLLRLSRLAMKIGRV